MKKSLTKNDWFGIMIVSLFVLFLLVGAGGCATHAESGQILDFGVNLSFGKDTKVKTGSSALKQTDNDVAKIIAESDFSDDDPRTQDDVKTASWDTRF